MAELRPLDESYWDRWPVSAVGDLVKDGMVFHPFAGLEDAWQPHEMPIVMAGSVIRYSRIPADELVFVEMDAWRKRHGFSNE